MSQLDALGYVVAALDEASIEYVLFGGWAVDCHAGEVTRPHEDLDLAVSEGGRERPEVAGRLRAALLAAA